MEYIDIYKFCPRCKSGLTADSEKYFHCTNCHFFFYVNPLPCNAFIAENNQGEILLVKRKYDPKKGYWDLPGGFINTNESVEDSIRREVLEELGVTIEKLQYFASYPDRYMYKNIHCYTLGMVYTGRIEGNNMMANDDVAEIKFFKKSEIPYNEIAFPSVISALKEYVASQ